jgi:hypothetical protein
MIDRIKKTVETVCEVSGLRVENSGFSESENVMTISLQLSISVVPIRDTQNAVKYRLNCCYFSYTCTTYNIIFNFPKELKVVSFLFEHTMLYYVFRIEFRKRQMEGAHTEVEGQTDRAFHTVIQRVPL